MFQKQHINQIGITTFQLSKVYAAIVTNFLTCVHKKLTIFLSEIFCL